MNPLSDVLRAVRLTGVHFYVVEGSSPWSVTTAPATTLVPRILPHVEHLIAFHIMCKGSTWVGLNGGTEIRLDEGDVVVFPHGDAHFVASMPGHRMDPHPCPVSPSPYPHPLRLGVGEPNAKIICGYLGCDARPFNPLLAALPRVIHMPRLDRGWLGLLPTTVLTNSSRSDPGAEAMMTRIAELMFIEVLRYHIGSGVTDATGWLAGLRDPVVGAALTRMHKQPARDWTLAELARETATSRSAFTKRFTTVMGTAPMQYLGQWRLQIASELLAKGEEKVAAVAARVGYDSEAAFSRAFKRATGASPARWRLGKIAMSG